MALESWALGTFISWMQQQHRLFRHLVCVHGAVLRHATPRCVLCSALLCRAVPCRAVPCRAVPCRQVLDSEASTSKAPFMSRIQQCFAVRPEADGLLDLARNSFCRVTEAVHDLAQQYAERYSLPALKVSLREHEMRAGGLATAPCTRTHSRLLMLCTPFLWLPPHPTFTTTCSQWHRWERATHMDGCGA